MLVLLAGCGERDLNLNGRCCNMKVPQQNCVFQSPAQRCKNCPSSLSSKYDEKKTCNINSHAHRVKDHAVFTDKFEDELVFEILSI